MAPESMKRLGQSGNDTQLWMHRVDTSWVQSQKRQNDLVSFPRQTIQYHSNQVYTSSTNAEEAEVD